MNGPSDKNLARLGAMLPSLVQGYRNGTFGPKPGGKSCVGCGGLFGRPSKDGLIKQGVCKKCQRILRAGGSIFVCTDNRVFSVIPKEGGRALINPKWRGRIVRVPVEFMDQLEKPQAT